MNMRCTALAVVAAAGLCGVLACGTSLQGGERKREKPERVGPTKVVREFLGDRALRVISSAEKVAVYRLGQPREGAGGAGETLHDFTVIGRGADQGAAFAGRLRDVLFDERTYDFRSAKACEFDPGVAFRLTGEAGEVDVVLCFSCNELMIVTADPRGEDPAKVGEDFDRARPALVALAKEAFPDDKEIQGLTDEAE